MSAVVADGGEVSHLGQSEEPFIAGIVPGRALEDRGPGAQERLMRSAML